MLNVIVNLNVEGVENVNVGAYVHVKIVGNGIVSVIDLKEVSIVICVS
jgi:hypothetical protein